MGSARGQHFNGQTGFWLPIVVIVAISLSITSVVSLTLNGAYAAREKDLRQWASTEVARGSNIKPTDAPCDPPSDLRTSDLCAQWKAADAARDGANWAVVAFIVGTIVNGATLIFVGLTFRETRELTIAAKREFESGRAWILCKEPNASMRIWTDHEGEVSGAKLTISVTWENFGSRPAVNVKECLGITFVRPAQQPHFNPLTLAGGSWSNVGAGQVLNTAEQTIEDELSIRLVEGHLDGYLRSAVSYADVLTPSIIFDEEIVLRLGFGDVTVGPSDTQDIEVFIEAIDVHNFKPRPPKNDYGEVSVHVTTVEKI